MARGTLASSWDLPGRIATFPHAWHGRPIISAVRVSGCKLSSGFPGFRQSADGNRVASGMQVAFGALGGIYASTVFMEKEVPHYRTGLWAVTVCLSLNLHTLQDLRCSIGRSTVPHPLHSSPRVALLAQEQESGTR